MEKQNHEIEFHSRISEKIYQTIGDISDEMDYGSISMSVARKIIRKVKHFNYNREVLVEKHKMGEISFKGFKISVGRAGQQCIDEINRIMAEASNMI